MGKKSKKTRIKNDSKVAEQDLTQNGSQNTSDVKFKYSANELLDKADEYLETFEHDMARRFCQRALEVEPLNCRALEMSGLLFLQAGDVDLAKTLYQKAVDLQPEKGHVKYMYLGQLSTGIEAINHYLKGIKIMSKTLAEFKNSQTVKESEVEEVTEAVSKKSKEPVCEVSAKDISSGFCAVAEIFLTDACFEDDADVRCKDSLDKAVEADPKNAEAYHLLASYWLSKDDKEKATEAIDHGVSLWLPQLRAADQAEGPAIADPIQGCSVPYQCRVNCCKILIELGKHEIASEVLELMLDEDDQVVEVWYLLGWLNYLLGEDYKANARHYLKKGFELAAKQHYEDDQMISHMSELLTDLGNVEEDDDDEENQMDEDDFTTDSEDDDGENHETNANRDEAMEH